MEDEFLLNEWATETHDKPGHRAAFIDICQDVIEKGPVSEMSASVEMLPSSLALPRHRKTQKANGESKGDGDEDFPGRNTSLQPSPITNTGYRPQCSSEPKSNVTNDNGLQEMFTTTLEYI